MWCPLERLSLTLERATASPDAWITVEIDAERVAVVDVFDLTDDVEEFDFSPAFAWAESCSLSGCAAPPPGWRLQTCDECGEVNLDA